MAAGDALMKARSSKKPMIKPSRKGAFHRWLGKPEGAPITDADIRRGLAAGGHAAQMANFARNFGRH
jgi:hypothetical protein